MGSSDLKFKDPSAFSKDMFKLLDTIKKRMCEDESGVNQMDALILILRTINKHKE